MKTQYLVPIVLILFMAFFMPGALGQPHSKIKYKIAFIGGFTEDTVYQPTVIREINALLESRGEVEYLMKKIRPYPLEKSLEDVAAIMADDTVDCIIGVGLEVSPKLSIVEINPGRIETEFPEIPPDADAVYLLPLFSKEKDEQMGEIIRAVNERQLPSFALMGEKHVRMGCMASIAPDQNFNAVSRRVAMNVLDILEGRDAGIAGAALLPQVDLSAGLSHIDKNRVEIAQTYPARTTLSASGSLNQTLFKDDLLANYEIQKILKDSQGYQERTTLLDTVVTATQTYVNLLFAMSDQTIRNNNVDVTRKNLEIAKNKAAVGAVDASEVNRWESEKATNQISLNDAFRDLQLARMTLNQVLDRPITREFSVEDIEPGTDIELLITDPRVYELLGNIKQVKRFSNFLITEADRNLPELKQIKEILRSQEREVLNRQSALFLPDVSLRGSLDKVLDEYDGQKTISDLDHPWTVSLTASWPIFAGGAHKKDLTQSRYRLQRLRIEEKKLRNQFHLNVRSSLETAAVSAREIDLSQRGLAAALKNFEIVQAGYAEGRNSVTDLIDAQNVKVRSELAAASAK